MKILIIGSNGMLGQYLAQVLRDYELILFNKKDLDITDEKQVNTKIIKLKPDVIINCGAYNNVDGCESNVELANLINGYAVGYLAKVAKKIGALIIHFSTGYIFDGKISHESFLGYAEDDEPNPQSAYAKSKLLGEQQLQKYTDKFYLIRTSRLFGKQGIGDGAKKPFVDLIIETAQKNNFKIKAIDEEYDLPTYGFDLAGKVKEIIENSPLVRGEGGVNYGIYHIANSGEPCTWRGFAKEIFKIKKMTVEIESVSGDAFGKRSAKRPMCCVLKNTKIKPLRRWEEALEEYLLKNY